MQFSGSAASLAGATARYSEILDISSVQDWLDFVESSLRDNYDGKLVRLMADIDLAGVNVIPVGGIHGLAFAGTFDGQGHIIRNFASTNGGLFYGLSATGAI